MQSATDPNQAPTIGKGTPPPPTTLLTKGLVVGTGPAATATSMVTVQYVGALYDTGEVFESTWEQEELPPFDLGTPGVIRAGATPPSPGWASVRASRG